MSKKEGAAKLGQNENTNIYLIVELSKLHTVLVV
jgi:hypothetical protein